ncbi:ester cyclase [Bradyrhizobium sp. 930_D9_N1_4]|uniref:ester cyclase n=1 Tax=Bradyrhizobium sp. 930_D9_N1_4 TaxID=3240374 RepID=UPI003F8CCE20
MTENLRRIYSDYLSCLNAQDWGRLALFVDDDVTHNERLLGLSGYREMLIEDYKSIPDLQFNAVFVLTDPPALGARLKFDCHPAGEFLGLAVNGKHVVFHENVFYEFRGDKIIRVRSVIDKIAIEQQI